MPSGPGDLSIFSLRSFFRTSSLVIVILLSGFSAVFAASRLLVTRHLVQFGLAK